MTHEITITVNGTPETHRVEPGTTLLRFLRDQLYLTGAKEGCGEGECGACVVLLDGQPVNSCLVLAVEVDGHRVTTVEGLASTGRLHPLQESFLRHHAVQCGFCTPGMLVSGAALLERHPDPTEEQIKTALEGNLCRCTGYAQIIEAIQDAARNDEAR